MGKKLLYRLLEEKAELLPPLQQYLQKNLSPYIGACETLRRALTDDSDRRRLLVCGLNLCMRSRVLAVESTFTGDQIDPFRPTDAVRDFFDHRLGSSSSRDSREIAHLCGEYVWASEGMIDALRDHRTGSSPEREALSAMRFAADTLRTRLEALHVKQPVALRMSSEQQE